MELLSRIIENPIYVALFGSGGILVIIIALISFKNTKRNENEKNIANDDNGKKKKEKEESKEHGSSPVIDKREEYEDLDFKSDEFYVTFLKTIDEKKKGDDKFEFREYVDK